MSDTFNPYREWLGLSGSPPANHYALLSLPVLESDQAKVAAACDRAITKVRSFRPGPNAKLWAQLLDEINRARTCLLDPARKAVYDAQLRGASAPALNEASLYAAPVPDFAAPTPLAADHLPMALPVAGRGEGFPPATPLTSHPAMAPYAATTADPMAPVAIPQQPWTGGHARPNPTGPLAVISTPAVRRRQGGRAFLFASAGTGLVLIAAAVALILVANRGQPSVAEPPPATMADEKHSPLTVSAKPAAKKRPAPVEDSAIPSGGDSSPREVVPFPQPVSAEPPTADPAATKATPAAPSPPPLPVVASPEESAALAKVLTAAKAALAERHASEADSLIIQAESLAKTPQHQQVVARLKEVARLVEQFQAAVTAAIDGLAAGASFKVGTSSEVAFVERQPDKIVLRVAGTNKAYPLADLPAGLALGLADLKLDAADPTSRAIKGAYLLTHKTTDADAAKRDREKGKALWEEAKAAGGDLERLMPFLTDNYEELNK